MIDLEKKVEELDKKLNALIFALHKKTEPELKLFPSAYIKDDLGLNDHQKKIKAKQNSPIKKGRKMKRI